MTQDARRASVLAVMMIATIYVVMLIGATRSRYFIGGGALTRSQPAATAYQLAATPGGARPFCLPRQPRPERLPDCNHAQSLELLRQPPVD